MKSNWLRILSTVLVIALLINMLPMSIFAEEFRESIANNETVSEEVVTEDTYVVSEVIEKRTEYSKEFLLSNGLHMATVYADPVHYETDNGWEEIDNTLKTNTDGTYSNTEGIWDVSLPQELSDGESVTIEKDGYTLSFSLTGELNTSQIATYGRDGVRFDIKGAKKSHGKVQKMDWDEMRQNVEFEEMVPQKSKSRLTYSDVYENTDIIYDLASNTVKESIVLESYSDTLQGYTYTLEVGTMIPDLEEDGQITLYDESRNNIVMVMPAPYLVDNAQEYNYDIDVQLTGNGSTYTLNYILPTNWLAAEDRAWPVIMDPWIEAEVSTSNISDVTVAQNAVLDYQWGCLQAGHGDEYGITRFYLMFDNLPALTSSDVIVHSQVSLLGTTEGLSDPTRIDVHKVNTLWESEGLTWSNKPSYNENIEDYVIVDTAIRYGWDITDIARGWYADKNTGMMFKSSAETEASELVDWARFYSSDNIDQPAYLPVLTIYFRNNNGLENYWDYTTSTAGRAGTGYVNNFTGNMTFIHNDIGFGGNRMPVSISHVYNLNDAIVPSDSNNSNDSGGNSFGMGLGWRTNYNQLVYKWEIDGEEKNYYIWEDEDGTDHYFEKDGNEYKDEDGLELTLTDTGSGTTKYCITDKNGNCSYFDTIGRLTKMSNNQMTKSSITITYTTSTGKLISSITDGAGRVYSFTYNSNSLLTRISYKGTGTTEISYVAFDYDGNKLWHTTDKDSKKSTYTYDGGLLKTVADIDGYMLTYSYNTIAENIDWQPYRTLSVSSSDGSAQGGSLTFSYAHNQTTVTDYNGNKEIYQFNDFGNTVSIQDDEGHATYAQYARTNKDDTAGKGNQLKVASKLQNTVGNLLKDSSFESANPWTVNNSALTVSRSTEESYHGNYSLKIVNPLTQTGHGAYSHSFTVAPWETVTFSAYVKSADAASFLALHYHSSSGTYVSIPSKNIDPSQGWTRQEVTFTNNQNTAITMWAFLFATAPGTFYLDCAQVEKSNSASRYNLVENGDFRYGEYNWGRANLSSTEACIAGTAAAPELENTVYKMVGDPLVNRYLYQRVYVSGTEGDTFVLSGWAKGDSAPLWENNARGFGLYLYFNNTDGTYQIEYFQFNPDADNWQYGAWVAVAEKPYSSINISLVYDNNVNTAWFDGIQLYKEEFGNSYTYDDKGNVISVEDLQGQTTAYEYDTNSNLTKVIQNNKAKMTYTYDDYHNVKTATTDTGLKYEFQYDTFGTNCWVSISSGGVTMKSIADYSDTGNYLDFTVDALGNKTDYQYNEDTGVLEWVQYPEDTEDTRTEYSYDSMYRMASAACATDTGLNLSAEYTYTDDLLTKIETPSTTYNFAYGTFDLRTGVSIGNRTLATYHYTEETTDDRKYDLDRLDYGNGDSVEYSYYDNGSLMRQKYEDGTTAYYKYDNSGNLASRWDSAIEVTTNYYYDFTDRMMKYVESGTGYSHSVGYEYDTLNNLTKLVEDINGTERTTTYTYDDDNRIETSTTGNITVVYDYDSFGRVETQTTKNGNTVILTESYTYKAPTSTTTSAQIATCTTSAPNGYSVTYSYTYDDNGNITSISDGTYTTSYAYDTANQLIRENNQAGNFTHTWTYDNAGNILNRKEYAYTTGTLGTPTDTVTYTYGDSQWGDLLTAYDEVAITYDQIGNPLSDGTWTYTWQHGRQLASMSKTGTIWNYTYNADGLRTQRTNGANTYSYIYNGGQLSQMTAGNNTLNFTYDANGTPLAVTHNGTTYYYATNQQGDVVALLSSLGNPMVEYTYDAWGNILSTTGTMAATLGAVNPLRYRGYIYDQETGLYYLQSRYYNPEIGRFINADGYISTGQGMLSNNMFVYCLNNPVMMFDTTGEIGVIPILLGVVGLAMILITPSSQRQQATPEQIDDAHKTASRAELTIRNDDSGEPSTIDIQIDTKDVIDSVDSIARNYYYEELYDRTIEKANEIGMSTDNLMSIAHISWEFTLHEIAYHLGIDNAIITDLNVEETPWSMIERAIGWD